MKHRILIFFSCLFFWTQGFSKQIDLTTAKVVALHFYNSKFAASIQINDIKEVKFIHSIRTESHPNKNQLIYIFNIKSTSGFVLISGDDIVKPILGYSNKGHIHFESSLDIPQGFVKLIDGYERQISYALDLKSSPTNEVSAIWESLLNNTYHFNSRAAFVNPLIESTWAQGQYYNEKCPNNSLAGCVAINVAQILNYHEHPQIGIGNRSYNHEEYGTISANFSETHYDFANMPNVLNQSSSNTEIEALSTLIFHAGVAVEMKYSPSGSSSHTGKAKNAFISHFGYDPTTISIESRSSYTNSQDWITMLKNELDSTRPIYYSGFCSNPQGGHAFLVDGYDVNNYFHLNWGWEGGFNGYFEIDNLNPSIYQWTEAHRAIIGIKPLIAPEYNIQMNSVMSTTPDTLEFNEPFLVDLYVLSPDSLLTDFMLLIFDENDVLVDTVEISPNNHIPANTSYNIVFYNSGTNLFPGQYHLAVYYRIDNGNWTLLPKNTYQNPQEIQVKGGNPSIVLGSNISINASNINQNQPFTIDVDITNIGNTDFFGDISVDIHTLDGIYVDEIDIYQSETIEADSTYTYSFFSNGLNELPGSYKIVVWVYDTSWEIAGSGNYSNFKTFNLSGIDFLNNPIDQYEPNNTWFNPYVFDGNAINYDQNNHAILKTDSANIHDNTDLDHYQLNLPTGYSYVVYVRATDRYNDTTGFNYSNDVMIKGLNHETNTVDQYYYDDLIGHAFVMNNGGLITVQALSYFDWEIGSYQLEFDITRSGVSTISENTVNEILIYPNPTKDYINISWAPQENYTINIYETSGKLVYSAINSTQKIDIGQLENGLYFVELITSLRKYRTKFEKLN